MGNYYQVLIVGAGNAGISAASQLLRKQPNLKIGIIEPSDKHYYQPAWTLVGAGQFNVKRTVRPQSDFIPSKATWIRDAVATFEPENNQLTCVSGQSYTYDTLLVAPGLQIDWQKIKGLPETLGKNDVTSNYSYDIAPYTWELIKNFKGGVAVFTNPTTPVKCGGAPHKIMYMACDYWSKNGVMANTQVHYISGAGAIFAVKEFADTLELVLQKHRIQPHYLQNVTAINGPGHTLYYEGKDAEGNVQQKSMKFDFAHVVPPQSAPDFIKASPLADPAQALGWIAVDKHTFQHVRFANVFACGDVSNAPISKTGAAIRKQVPVTVAHMLAYLNKTQATERYEGYTACPIPTQIGKLMLAEFDYSNKPKMSFPIDQTKPQWSMWVMKKHLLPWMYWNKILRGTA